MSDKTTDTPESAEPPRHAHTPPPTPPASPPAKDEVGGPKGPEPTRYGDWERKGRCIDF